MAKSNKQFYFSPVGTVMPYAWIQKPDTKYKAQGEYKIDLKVPNAKAQKLVDFITEAYEANWEENKNNPKLNTKGKKAQQADLPFYEEDGFTIFKFRMNASYIKKDSDEVVNLFLRVVDSSGTRMPVVPNISAGSEGKCRFSLIPFAAVGQIGVGIKLQLDSFMLTKLVEYSAGTGVDSNWASEAEEDGYKVTDTDWSKQSDGSNEPDYDSDSEEPEEDDQSSPRDF